MTRLLRFLNRFRRVFLAGALLATLAATVVVNRMDETGAPTPRQPRQSITPPAAPSVGTERIGASTQEDEPIERVDVFAVRSWEPPPPPPPPPAPPPPPQAPPLPFKFLGRIEESPQPTAFLLSYEGQILSLTPGQEIDARYSLEKFEAGQLQFLYRPMNIKQTLHVGTSP